MGTLFVFLNEQLKNLATYRQFTNAAWDWIIQKKKKKRGLFLEGSLRFKIDWANLIVGRKFTVFALFYFVFEGNFQVQAPARGLYLKGWFNGGFLRHEFGGRICGGAYFRNFTVFVVWKNV